jgi:tRNA A-37 threonylcarbamoyl transferase component Bud32
VAELSRLGRYELRQILGKGAMGVVYEGFDPTLGRRVAVKTILKSVAHDDETERNYAERFVREAKAVARLNHPNIVQVHDFGVENEVAYLVMEFIQGRELRSHFLAGERFETAECVRIMGELLDALDFAHEAGVIHRDIKPANVMLDAQRRVKLADFGVARVQDSERSAAGTMVGTPAFMSPEQISGGKIDRRTDIFSAGTILYQLLTGEQPFKGDGAWTVAKQIMQDDPPHPSSVVQSVSPAFDGIVSKALAKKPKERYASAREFASALRGTQAPGALAPAVVMPKPKPRAEPKASDTELEFWRAIQNSTDAAEFEFYLEQFPEGTYAQLARHKIAKLRSSPDAQATVRLEAEAQAQIKAAEERARQEAEELARRNLAEERARQEAEERARKEAEERSRQEAEAKAKREAEEQALREALEKTRREAAEKSKREAAEKARRDAEEKIRQAQALARLRQQEEAKARAKAAVDEDATVAIGDTRPAAAPPAAERKSSHVLPAAAAIVVIAAGIGAYVFLGRTPAPAPVAQAPAISKVEQPAPAAPPKAELSAADIEKIRKETEERIRREYADKSAAEQAKAAKAAADKEVQEKQQAMKAAAERTAQEKQLAAKLAQERAAAEKVAAEKIAAERAASEKVARIATEKAAEEKAAAAKAIEEKAAAARAAEKAAVAAATTPAAQPPGKGLAGRYAFRIMTGSGMWADCDHIDVQEDIEIHASSPQSISGKSFSNLRFQIAPDGSLAATAQGVRTRTGTGEVKLAGRVNSTGGYAGTYELRWGGRICTGLWTLVRKGDMAAEKTTAPAKAPPVSVAAAAPATTPREAGLPGRYAFRVMAGAGVQQLCDRNGFEEEIEIRAGSVQAISGRQFSDLQIQSAQDGSLTGTLKDGSNRFGVGDLKLAGRATASGYAGTYAGQYWAARCSGQWTLVRKQN